MLISISADSANSKNIPTLLQEMGYSIPCNCHGAHLCNGARYPFDCAYIPKSPLTIDWNPQSNAIHGLSLETLSPEDGQGDTMLIDIGTTTIAFALISRMSGTLRHRESTAPFWRRRHRPHFSFLRGKEPRAAEHSYSGNSIRNNPPVQ